MQTLILTDIPEGIDLLLVERAVWYQIELLLDEREQADNLRLAAVRHQLEIQASIQQARVNGRTIHRDWGKINKKQKVDTFAGLTVEEIDAEMNECSAL